MSDIKDILGVPREGAAPPKQEKPKEPKRVKPKGMSRCVLRRYRVRSTTQCLQ